MHLGKAYALRSAVLQPIGATYHYGKNEVHD